MLLVSLTFGFFPCNGDYVGLYVCGLYGRVSAFQTDCALIPVFTNTEALYLTVFETIRLLILTYLEDNSFFSHLLSRNLMTSKSVVWVVSYLYAAVRKVD